LGILSTVVSTKRNIPICEAAFYLLDEDLRHSSMGYQIQEKINVSKAMKKGKIFPHLELLDINNNKFSLDPKK